ncbi:YggS family pyridoxal phosphate-dependent enzyme [Chitinophaga nivalis]|uniref:Pyridoxal phosphate homeostasis protein n=1 Tax=Chitinophaga nivalis TaxID=2991709 RepID=A0ABT3IQ19_9BACT|nr:YggS family pyridoxal phosphate-dependent enzyme [Chitinophaga nivalis]MCW3464262.1 YggS family pyridoxal phosphate-dependent enzyme [Chitinophaga nivalis]MCW3486047.1 YggS family pyridoxal phosphate-dependent enzyme [Chitinophaga nivalis]
MSINLTAYQEVLAQLLPYQAKLVAVSKTKPVADLEAFYAAGQRIFGENYVQELTEKQAVLPADIEWHFIGHLQSNKVKYIAPFVHTIHAVDSLKLLQEINKQAVKNQRVINCLLQVHVAAEETKFGMDEQEVQQLLQTWQTTPAAFSGIRITGMMGMATNTTDETQIRKEFHQLRQLFGSVKNQFFNNEPYFHELSIGMSADYTIALQEGSTMVRIGSLLFGERNYSQN